MVIDFHMLLVVRGKRRNEEGRALYKYLLLFFEIVLPSIQV